MKIKNIYNKILPLCFIVFLIISFINILNLISSLLTKKKEKNIVVFDEYDDNQKYDIDEIKIDFYKDGNLLKSQKACIK